MAGRLEVPSEGISKLTTNILELDQPWEAVPRLKPLQGDEEQEVPVTMFYVHEIVSRMKRIRGFGWTYNFVVALESSGVGFGVWTTRCVCPVSIGIGLTISMACCMKSERLVTIKSNTEERLTVPNPALSSTLVIHKH